MSKIISLVSGFFCKINNFANNFYDLAKKFLRPVYESRYFDKVAGLVSWGNPIAMFPQLVSSFTSSPKDLMGVSLWTFGTFIILQATFCLLFLKEKNKPLFFAMLLLVLETILIVSITAIRRHP